jgi:hypothetical protein
MSKLGLLVGIETLASQGVRRVTSMGQLTLYKITLYQNIACSLMIRSERLRPPKGTLLRRCYPITIFVNCPLISLIGSSQLELAGNVHPYALTTALIEWTP